MRQTCRSCSDHLAPSQGSTWPRTRTLGSQRSALIIRIQRHGSFNIDGAEIPTPNSCKWCRYRLFSCCFFIAYLSNWLGWSLMTCTCFLQGFAFISFHRREDAARAIAGVSGFGYDHLILNVEWAK